MLISTVPLPVSLAGETDSHDDPLVTDAVQEQWFAVLTLTFFVVLASLTCIVIGVTVNEHGAAACVTVNDCPAIVNVAVRAAPVLAAAATVTDPMPVPLPPVTVIHDGAPFVVQAHPAVAVTAMVVELPATVGLKLVGLMLYVHAAACVTVNDWPAIVSVAVRVAPVLAATATVTDPLPLPLPPVTVIHAGAPLVVHVHAEVVVTATVVEPPAALGLALVGLIP